MSSRGPRPPPRRRRPPRPSCCCCCRRRSHLDEDTGRFVLLAALIGLYLVAGATVFSALESPGEAEARARWGATLRNFSAAHGVAEPELRAFLRHYEAALAAGVRADALRPRWDFPGAFYFVGTVVSTIGERRCRALPRASLPAVRGPAPPCPFRAPLLTSASLSPLRALPLSFPAFGAGSGLCCASPGAHSAVSEGAEPGRPLQHLQAPCPNLFVPRASLVSRCRRMCEDVD